MNKAIIIGNLTKDPEQRVMPQGKSVCTFTVAVNRGFGDKNSVDYIPVVAWEKLADNCVKFLAKGHKVGVSGRIQTRSYDAQDGSRRYVTEIIADDVEFLTPKGERAEAAGRKEETNYDPEFEPLDEEQMPF